MTYSDGVMFMAARDVTGVQGLAYRSPATTRVASGIDVRRVARPAAAGGLIAVMALGSVAVWTVIPLGGLWLASQVSLSYTQLSAGPLFVAAVGIPIAMVLAGKALARVERLYLRLAGTAPTGRTVPPWRRSLTDSRPTQLSVLDRIMVGSVVLAVIAFAVWFFLFAGDGGAAFWGTTTS
jgi:hypothetical protein